MTNPKIAARNGMVNIKRADAMMKFVRPKGDYGISLAELVSLTGKNEHAVKSVMGWCVKNGYAKRHDKYDIWYSEEEIVNNETRHSKPVSEEVYFSHSIDFQKIDSPAGKVPKNLIEKEPEMSPEKLYHQMVLGMALYVAGVAAEKLK